MKLATIERGENHAHVAVVADDDELLDLVGAARRYARGQRRAGGDARSTWRRCGCLGRRSKQCTDGVAAMADDEREALRGSDILQAWDSASFLPPVPNPTIILSVGMNYHAHLKEMQNSPALPFPPAFLMTHQALSGHGKPIIAPPQCPDMVDYEGELCFVFGRTCYNVSEEEAMDYVAGYTIGNDVSGARLGRTRFFPRRKPFDVISAWDRNLLGKQLPTFCPCGPVIVTKDEIADPHNLQMTTTLNGEVMQSSKTDDLIFNLPQIISYFSQWYRFSPGDIVHHRFTARGRRRTQGRRFI